MKNFMYSIFVVLLLSSFIVSQQTSTPALKWYKGNTHTHTSNSDGDSPPSAVVKWYLDNKYNFLFITDHEFITPAAPLNAEFGKAGEFLVIQGQEVTGYLNKKAYHVNALGVDTVTRPNKALTIVENLQQNIDAVRAIGGLPQINHPNYLWSITSDHLVQLKNTALIEIFNGHPLVNNIGAGGSPGTEEMWDTLLTAGKLIYGAATDDSHYFKQLGERKLPTPGKGWVYVRAESLEAKSILVALEKGDFYASTGVELVDYSANKQSVSIKIREEQWSKYTIQFIGSKGGVLKSVPGGSAVYTIRGNEGYVRVKILESNGKMAWTQPVMLGRK